MDTSKINNLKNRAFTVKNATAEGENTAERIGQLMYDMIDYDADQSSVITALERKSDNMQEQINDIIEGGGGGGGEGTSGQQETFFINIIHNTVPTLPSVSEYDGSTQTFVHDTQVWSKTNTNPGENEDTYMLWAWFVDGLPQSVSGPVRIYNSASGGSNGEDANETEWVYRRISIKPSAQVLAQWTTDLANAKGTNGTGNKNYTVADVVPPDWNDNAQGIDETNKYEYASFRVSALDANGKRKWGDTGFSEPILWSNWGEKGTDGDGIEYIFYADSDGRINGQINHPETWTESTPGKDGKTFQDNEFIAQGSDWMDEPIDLEEAGYGQGSVEFVSIRKKRDDVWQAYSEPKPWTRYAKDGVVDGYTVDFVNENMPVNTDEGGNVSSYQNNGWVQVFHNSTPVDYADSADSTHYTYTIGTITRSDSGSVSGISVTKNSSDKTQVDVSISNLSGFKSVNAYVPITVTLPNGTTRKLECTLYGVVSGEFIDLYVSTKAIRVLEDGSSPQPSVLEMGTTLGKTTYKSVYGAGSGSAEALGYYFAYGYDLQTPTVHGGNILIAGGHTTLDVYMYKDNTFIDSESIPFIKDGKTGPQGNDGNDGRGILRTTSYYKANATKSAPSITTSDATDPANTDWSESKPYLYARDYITFTNGDVAWAGDAYLKDVWTAGQGGETTTMYDLIPTPAAAKFYLNSTTNTLSPDSISVSCKGKQISGSTSTDFTQDSPDSKYHIYFNFSLNTGGISSTSVYSGSGLSVGKDSAIVAVNFYLANNANLDIIVKQVSVPADRDGLKGQDGSSSTGGVGKFYYFGGDFDFNPTLTVDDYQAPYVQYGGKYYMYVGEGPVSTSVVPTADTTNWKEIKYEQYFMSDAMFANYAHMGAAIFNRDWMISQYGSINGASANPSRAYTSFDPLAFMTWLKPNEGASIGVITRSSGTNSQIFVAKGTVTAKVKGSGTTQLAKFNNSDFYRFDNSGSLSSSLYTIYSYGGTSSWTVNNTSYTTITITAGTYCFLGGNISDIKIVYSSSSVFVPNYALDLRSGFVYQNNAYVSGTINATNGVFKGNLYTPALVITSSNFSTYHTSVSPVYNVSTYQLNITSAGLSILYQYNEGQVVSLPSLDSSYEGAELRIVNASIYSFRVFGVAARSQKQASGSFITWTTVAPYLYAGDVLVVRGVMVDSAFKWLVMSYQKNYSENFEY